MNDAPRGPALSPPIQTISSRHFPACAARLGEWRSNS
ncbi:EspF repeat-containing protein [Microbacterium sp. NIBRBAC000506063]